ncbi:MAG: aspartate kinase [Cyclobacteriaceae bacterium]|nr:aspartate kinase [Cyclobacteriaceae bacterium]
MLVLKFGGTSVGLPERMHKVARLITQDEERKIVVLSAVSGTTNSLVELCDALYAKKTDKANELVYTLENKYNVFIGGLYAKAEFKTKAARFLSDKFVELRKFTEKPFTEKEEKEILAQGEVISTYLFHQYLHEAGISSVLLDSLEFMKTDESDEPDMEYITDRLRATLAKYPNEQLFIAQGYICLNRQGEVDNLKRGGSDYSASLIGAGAGVEEIQIWTDIDGMHNNDPRIVEKTYPVAELSFDEAAELAYFGAKILHPSSILPAQKYNIPVRLKSTLDEEAPGTLISKKIMTDSVKAIAVKDGITAIKVKSSRMLLAHGFLRRLFEVFERYETSIDMVTTSEVAVSLTIDYTKNLDKIIDELENFGFVEVDKDLSIICIVGNMVSEQKGVVRKIFNALSDIPIRMVSYGGSRFNISMVIERGYKAEALNNLNTGLFEKL